MSAKLILCLVASVILSLSAVALTVTQPEFDTFASVRNYSTKADFDRAFAQFVGTTPFDSERIAADREKLRAVGLTRINSSQLGEE
jgi:Na+-transporting NADH:ubiquinone oxidoreductase subunit NqrC